MSIFSHKMVNGQRVEHTAEEVAELEARAAAYKPPLQPVPPTKEELLVQLQALQAKIQALE